MRGITVRDIAEAAGGLLLAGDPDTEVTSVVIDSRQTVPGCLFVPIIGEKTDAHRFLPDVCRTAAAVFTSEHESAPEETGISAWIRVADTVDALTAVGRLCRSRAMIPAIGVTGSVGKTTTREMIASALSAEKKVFKTSRNFNSRIGLPVTLSELDPDADIAVLELGMNVPGELTDLARLAKVQAAVITNIGQAHMEFYGSQEGICREKLSVTEGLLPGGVLILNGDDPFLRAAHPEERFPVIWYGEDPVNDVHAEDVRMEDGYASFTAVLSGKRVPVSLHVPGRHNVGNALAALAAAERFGVDIEKAAVSLGTYSGFAGRLLAVEAGGVSMLDDAYNASPASMKAGLDVVSARRCAGKRIAVLGDMFELGNRTEDFHREVGACAAGKPLGELVTVGKNARLIAEAAKEGAASYPVFSFDTREEALEHLLASVRPGDLVYFKASNSMKLGALAADLRARLESS